MLRKRSLDGQHAVCFLPPQKDSRLLMPGHDASSSERRVKRQFGLSLSGDATLWKYYCKPCRWGFGHPQEPRNYENERDSHVKEEEH